MIHCLTVKWVMEPLANSVTTIRTQILWYSALRNCSRPSATHKRESPQLKQIAVDGRLVLRPAGGVQGYRGTRLYPAALGTGFAEWDSGMFEKQRDLATEVNDYVLTKAVEVYNTNYPGKAIDKGNVTNRSFAKVYQYLQGDGGHYEASVTKLLASQAKWFAENGKTVIPDDIDTGRSSLEADDLPTMSSNIPSMLNLTEPCIPLSHKARIADVLCW
ncbi:hypothetical protein N0V85_004194 [Neurospora sp. IMI 360204]|nr:hypothetical protein N0V85_004194 [Neurospora sp. IMI 360204]